MDPHAELKQTFPGEFSRASGQQPDPPLCRAEEVVQSGVQEVGTLRDTLKRVACLVGKEWCCGWWTRGGRCPRPVGSEADLSCFKAQGIRDHPLLLLQGGG